MNMLLPAFSALVAFLTVFGITPRLISRMRKKGIVGTDVNKKDKRKIPEMGGIAIVMGFVISITVAACIGNMVGSLDISVILASGGVVLISAFIGMVDDILTLSQKIKAVLVVFASIPLLAIHPVDTTVVFPFGISFPAPFYIYWLLAVPFGITGAANALNMSAGYNGLETGEVAVMSTFLALISYIKGSYLSAEIIFLSLLGASVALYYFNRYPAKIFVGDVGTLSMGAAIAVGVIIGKIEFYGVIVILPAFFELLSTLYHNLKHVDRKTACRNPIILEDERLKTPEGAKWFTLAYLLLSHRPMGEKELVHRILGIYALCGLLALLLAFF